MADKIEEIFREALDISDSDNISDDICMEDTPAWDSLAQMTIIIRLKNYMKLIFYMMKFYL